MRFVRLTICGLVMAAVMAAGFDAGSLSLGGSTAYARHRKHRKHHRKHARKRHKRHRSGSSEL